MRAPYRVVCPTCGQTNNVPADKPALSGRCGICHSALFTGHPVSVDGAQFAKHSRNGNLPILVDVWAPWCGPCRAMAPMFERAAKELEPDVRLLKLNSDEEPGIASQLGIASIPTLILLRNGQIVARSSGVMDTQHIIGWVRSTLPTA